MSKKNNNNEQYRNTLRGLLSLYLTENSACEVYNAIELLCRRKNLGIAINEDNRLDFVQMEMVEEKEDL